MRIAFFVRGPLLLLLEVQQPSIPTRGKKHSEIVQKQKEDRIGSFFRKPNIEAAVENETAGSVAETESTSLKPSF